MLGRNYRITIQNGTGVAVTAAVTARRWKFASTGALVYEAAESTLFTSVSISSAAYTSATAIDNSADLYLGADLEVVLTPSASATGTVVVQIQRSTDGGTTWPSNGLGEFVGAHTFSASAVAVTRNMTISA